MAIAICPLDDDRGACKLIPEQFVVLCSVDDLFCALRSSGGVNKKDLERSRGQLMIVTHVSTAFFFFLLLFISLFYCSDLYERRGSSVFTQSF